MWKEKELLEKILDGRIFYKTEKIIEIEEI